MNLLNRWLEQRKQGIFLNRLFTVLSIDILVKLSGVILLPLYLRLMTQEEYGLYNYLLSIILTFSLVLNFGLYIPVSKFYHDSTDPAAKGKLLFTTFSLLLGALACVIIIIYAFRLDYVLIDLLFSHGLDYSSYRTIILVAIVVAVLSFMLTSYFFTSERIKQVKRYNLSRIVIIHLVAIALLYFVHDRNAAELRLQATYLLELAIFVVFSITLIREMRPAFDSKIASSSARLAMPIMLSALFGIVINFSDKFFLEKYGSLTDLSNYYLAVAFASILPTIFASVQNAWIPIFMKEKNLAENVTKTNKLIKKLALVFVAISILIWLFFRILLSISIIPSKYETVVFVLPLLLATQITAAISALYNNYLVYFERTHLISITGFFIGVVTIAVSLYLIPRWGIYGAAVATFVSNGLYLLTYFYLARRLIVRHRGYLA